MWEAIQANKRKSVALMFNMALVLLALGFVIGLAVSSYSSRSHRRQYSSSTQYSFPGAEVEPGGTPVRGDSLWTDSVNLTGGFLGMAVAAAIWFFMTLTAYFEGDSILLASNRARPIEKRDHPQLFNVVEEMAIAAGLSTPPRVCIIEDQSLNAFATGRDPEHATIAVTSGLLGRLNRDQLQGVVAHEMSHILNRDILFMTLLGVMVGSIVLISDVFLRGVFHTGGHRRGRSSNGGGQAQLILFAVAVLFAIVAPFLAQVIYFASSRRREFLADAAAVLLTRAPEGRASALPARSRASHPMTNVNKVTAPMYIDNPFKEKRSFFSG
jgi:heat shock protein HtpX